MQPARVGASVWVCRITQTRCDLVDTGMPLASLKSAYIESPYRSLF
jgi:hypothetical protein